MSLKYKVLNGVKWTTISTLTNAILQLLQIYILAHYLDPSVFGLISIIMFIIGFCKMFVDIGVSSAIIHKQNITDKQLSSLYWFNIVSAVVIFLIIIKISPYVAKFYNNLQLTNLIILTSSIIIIQSFGKQFFVLFEKELLFNLVAKIDILAYLSGFIVLLILIINNFGIYSFIYSLIVSTTLRSFLLIVRGIKYYKPKLYFNFYDIKEFITFGLYQIGSSIINYFNSHFDIILISKLFGTETLGLYSMAKQLVMRPAQIINPIVTRVTFPVMAKVQNDTNKLKNIYLKTINYTSSINFPIYISMIILAPELISILLGEKWIKSVQVFQILSFYALLRSAANPIGSLVLSKGKPQYEMYWNIGWFFIIPIVIVFSSSFGIEGISYALVILMFVMLIVNWYFLVYKLCRAKFLEYFLNIFKPLLLSSIGGLSYIFIGVLKVNIIFKIFVFIFIYFIFIIMLYYIFNKELIKLIFSMFKRN